MSSIFDSPKSWAFSEIVWPFYPRNFLLKYDVDTRAMIFFLLQTPLIAHLKYIYPGAKVVYIGDTLKDKEAAEGADTSFVHASYGYGHGLEADRKIDQLNDLLTLLL